TMHYDDRGLLSSTVHSQFIAGSWQVIKTVTTTFNDDLSIARVDAIDIAGGVHRADITEYDTSGREKQVEYSNNTRVTLNYDPVTGNLVELEWVDGNGERWVDTTVRSSQSGRILSHTLSSPSGTAAYEYGYQSGTRYLEWADLLGDGDVPSYSWHYEYAYDGEGACSNHNAAAALDGARTQRTTGSADGSVTLDYCYDEQLAPVQVRETTDSVLEGVSVRDVPLDLQDGAITRYESARLFYDIEEQLVRVEDGATTIQYIRDAAGNIVEEWVDTGEDTVVRRNRAGGIILDEHDQVVSQLISLPGGLHVSVNADNNPLWSYPNQAGHLWWSANAQGIPAETRPVYYSPDGESLTSSEALDPLDPNQGSGWKMLSNGKTIAVSTPLIEFGSRVYVPALGAFTTSDPVPLGGITPYVFANNDGINNIDPDGMTSFHDIATRPDVELGITIGLTVGMALSMAMGAPWLALVFQFALTAYDIYLTAYYFAEGDYLSGVMYAVNAGMSMLAFAGTARLAMRSNVTHFIKTRHRAPLAWVYKTGKQERLHYYKIKTKYGFSVSSSSKMTMETSTKTFSYTAPSGVGEVRIHTLGWHYPFRATYQGTLLPFQALGMGSALAKGAWFGSLFMRYDGKLLYVHSDRYIPWFESLD
ncbi:MAG TPA: hypothetical protein ENI05_07570, partial [Porticoccus sp.]|nr:hypothetical protein [Porticoccus sp.]